MYEVLNEYERYQLEWMIAHGHSLKELVEGLTEYQNDLESIPGVNLTVAEVYEEWLDERGFGGEIFSNEREYVEEDQPHLSMRRYEQMEPNHFIGSNTKRRSEIARGLELYNDAFYNPASGELIAGYLAGYDHPSVELYAISPSEVIEMLSSAASAGADLDYGPTTHELAADYAAPLATAASAAAILETVGGDFSGFVDASEPGDLLAAAQSFQKVRPGHLDAIANVCIEASRAETAESGPRGPRTTSQSR